METKDYLVQPIKMDADDILEIGQRFVKWGCFQAKFSEIKDLKINFDTSEVVIYVNYPSVNKIFRLQSNDAIEAYEMIRKARIAKRA